jgi:hypothetical protein
VWLIGHAGIGGRWHDLVALAAAGVLGGFLYALIVFVFRRALPLGRLSRRGA